MLRNHVGPVIYDHGEEKIDPECIPLCDAMNALEGIETISSCCGHEYELFSIYFVADLLEDLKPLLALIDDVNDGLTRGGVWQMRVSLATGDMEVYFILDGPAGDSGYRAAQELALAIADTQAANNKFEERGDS